MRKNALARLSLAILAALAALTATAQERRAPVAFVQAGSNPDGVDQGAAGVIWPLAWTRRAAGGEFSALVELSLSGWHARNFSGGAQNFWNLTVVPLLRYRLAEGQSPWFVEGGIGINASHKRYTTPDKTFSTRLNFSDNLALGRSFGQGWNQELSLRLQHTSNAGIKKPNPGEDFVLLRYACRF